MSFDAWVSSTFGDKNKGWQKEFRCPYFLCQSNTDDNRIPAAGFRPARMKFVQKLQPSVYQYRCKDCGCLTNVSVETLDDGRESWKINPALVSGDPSFNLNWRR
jgi:hypothetical protein